MGSDRTLASSSDAWVSHLTASAQSIDNELANWFRDFQRDFKFRQTRDPYAIMVSEFMLQQTTVAAVQPYYERFLLRFPDIFSLAGSSEDEVLALWAGLGYYRRARQLRAAAIEIVERHNGSFPRTVDELEKLPGIGRYTAGAIVSSAFDIPAPILEANTIRVFARLGAIGGVVGASGFMKSLWSVSDLLVRAAASPRVFNIAAMELGAVVCRPQPRCEICPVQEYCLAYRLGLQEAIPVLPPRRETIDHTTICFLIQDEDDRYLVRRIPKGEWHQGMWEFPSKSIELNTPREEDSLSLARMWLAVTFTSSAHEMTLKYQVTHHKVKAYVFRCYPRVRAEQLATHSDEFQFVSLTEMETLAFGSAQKKLFKLLQMSAQENTL